MCTPTAATICRILYFSYIWIVTSRRRDELNLEMTYHCLGLGFIISITTVRPPDIVVGGLRFYRDSSIFYLFSLAIVRARWTELNQNRPRARNIHCEPKKHTKMFLSYLPQNSVDSDKSWHTLSWINLRYSSLNVFQLTWILSLHYLVKLSVRVL